MGEGTASAPPTYLHLPMTPPMFCPSPIPRLTPTYDRYPHCLFFLDLVQSSEFRTAIASNKVSVGAALACTEGYRAINKV